MKVSLSVLASVALVVGALDSFIAREHPSSRNPSSFNSELDLRAAYERAYAYDSANWLANASSTDPFYQSPANISAYAPGDIVRIERVSHENLKQYIIPPGLSMVRMLYQSLDLDNKPVPASAFILLPYSWSRPHAPLSVIVWTHGTSGIERQCGPSNQRNLYYDFDGPFAMALRGYAVIAPDYAGLGSDTTFNYLAAPSHAADVAFSVVAARRAFPLGFLDYGWVVIGHSEGGLTAWAVNEQQVTHPIGGFRGSVSIAPALLNLQIIRHGVENDKLASSLFYSSYTLTTIARLDKSVDVTRYFSDIGLKLTKLAATACFHTAAVIFEGFMFSDIFKDPTWLYSSWADAWENRTAVRGDKPLAQPLLLVEGLDDRSVFPAIPEGVFEHHCSVQPDTRVHLSRYPEMDHDPLAYVSQNEYFDWVEDRFNGVPVSRGCTNATVEMIYPDSFNNFALVVQS